MNKKVVVVGVAVVVIVATIAAILLLNHPNSSNYSSVSNTITPSSTTTVTPRTSTNINRTTSTSTNTSLPMNSFYFVGENNTGYYYIFVLNLTSYKEVLQQNPLPNVTIFIAMVGNNYIYNPKTVERGDYLFVIGYMLSNANFSIGSSYPAGFWLSNERVYETQLTYEGNWTGSIP